MNSTVVAVVLIFAIMYGAIAWESYTTSQTKIAIAQACAKAIDPAACFKAATK